MDAKNIYLLLGKKPLWMDASVSKIQTRNRIGQEDTQQESGIKNSESIRIPDLVVIE